MTIIIAGTVDFPPEAREEALQAGIPHVEAARAEKGCIHYVWSPDYLTPGRIYVYEEWATQEDLAAHLVAPPYFNMRDTLAGFGLLGAVTNKYRIDREEPVYDETLPATAYFTDETPPS